MHSKEAMQHFVIDMLMKELPSSYYYHNYQHTLYVQDKVAEIGHRENCTEYEIELLKVAALWHDAGYLNTYAGHEEESCLLARRYLPVYNFSDDEIKIICGMIKATKLPQQPQNKLEEIIADADLEYLSTPAAAAIAENLFKELHSLNPSLTKASWNQVQISFLQSHHYFTAFCKKNKEQAKKDYLNKLLVAGF